MKAFFLSFLVCLIFSGQSFARDTIETLDGSILSGTIKQLNPDHIVLSTDYAGEITLQRVKSLAPHQNNQCPTDSTMATY